MALAPETAAAALVRLRKLLGADSGKALTDAERGEILDGRSATAEALGALAWRRILSASKAPIGYVDFTFSADKSVSLAWAFAPTEAEREHARRVVAAFATAPATGVVSLDGRMIDRPHLLQAQRILAVALRAGDVT